MRAWNRAKLLWGYFRRKSALNGLPVEYIVETTAKCNLYCPMCPRETHKQPKEDMSDEIFNRLVEESGQTGEHMMLIGLGEPFMDRKIFDRIEYCKRHDVATLLSTNGTLLDEKVSARILDSTLENITLSFDGTTKESYEHYRKGAKFEKVRDNFINFARMKHERKAKVQIVMQMVRMEKNANEVDEFLRFWKAVPGIDQVRIKEDETNVLQPAAGRVQDGSTFPCHYLWRGPMYVKHNGDVYPCCQAYMLDGAPIGRIGEQPLEEIWNSADMQELRRLHATGRAGEVDMCARCCASIPHPVLVAGSLVFNGKHVRRMIPIMERIAGRLFQRPAAMAPAPAPQLVQIETAQPTAPHTHGPGR